MLIKWYKYEALLGSVTLFLVLRAASLYNAVYRYYKNKYQQFVNGMQLHTQLQTGTGTWIYNLWKKTS